MERVTRGLTGGRGAAALVVVLVAVWLALPPGPVPPALEVGIHLWVAAAVRRGLRRHQPVAWRRWHAMMAAFVLFALSSVAESLALLEVATPTTTVVESVLDVGGYAAVAGFGFAVLVTGRRWRDSDRWLDLATLVLAVVLTCVAWTDGARLGAAAR